MNGNNSKNNTPQGPQSWNDLVVMTPMDPRAVISSTTFQNSAGAAQPGVFLRSSTFLHAATWVNPPMIVNTSLVATVGATNSYDFDAIEQALTWNGLHQMTVPNALLPLSVSKIIFLKAGTQFVNTIFLDWTGGTTSSSDVEISFRDNSTTSGIFQNAGTGTMPVFSFGASSYGGTGRALTLSLLRTGRFPMAMRLIDSSGNYSMFEMDWIVLP